MAGTSKPNELMNEIADLLGISQRARRYVITFEVGCEPLIDVQQYPERTVEGFDELELLSKQYVLREVGDDSPCNPSTVVKDHVAFWSKLESDWWRAFWFGACSALAGLSLIGAIAYVAIAGVQR